MGKSSAPTIGYWHKMTLYTGYCHGPVDALRALEWGGEMAWEGNQTSSGRIVINKPELFGGEKKEGGINGWLDVRMGEPDQMPHPLMQQLVPGPWPAARQLVTGVFDGDVSALSPYVKDFRTLWSRWVKGWRGGSAWQPALCKIGEGMNPAHIIYQSLTDTDWGYGASPAEVLDEDNLLAVAQTLYDEEFGLCLGWQTGVSIGDWLDTICEHIGAVWGERDDKIVVTLIRDDYDVDELPLLDKSNIMAVEEWSTPGVDGGVNEVVVVGKDCMTGNEIARTYQNLASIQAQGRVVSEKRQLPGLWNLDLVARVAARECNAKSHLAARMRLKVKASAGPFVRGEVRALSWEPRGVARMPIRIMEIDEGTVTDSAVSLVAVQDVAGMAQTSYIGEVTSGWQKPDTTPLALSPETVYEATYRDLAGLMRPADLALVADDAGYLVALGARPVNPSYDFTLVARTGSAAFAATGSGDFSPCGVLDAAIGPAATTLLLNSYTGLTMVAAGEECIIGGLEHCRVTSVDAGTGEIGIARGCVDTVPRSHAAGAVVWFPDTYHGYGRAEYVDGETVDAKLRTRTASGTLAEADATTRSVTMDSRQARPYPPGRFRINATAWPASSFARLALTWAHRDRQLQADQLVDEAQGDVGPEAGTTYTVRIYQQPSTLLHTESGLTGTSYSYDVLLASDADIRIELDDVRDGLASWQRQTHVVACECGNKATNGAFGSDSDWTKGTGWTIGNGYAAHAAGTASDLSQDVALVAGGVYRIDYTLSAVSAGSVTAGLAGGAPVNGAARSASGTYTETVTAAAGNTLVRFAADAAFVGRVDNVAIRRLT